MAKKNGQEPGETLDSPQDAVDLHTCGRRSRDPAGRELTVTLPSGGRQAPGSRGVGDLTPLARSPHENNRFVT